MDESSKVASPSAPPIPVDFVDTTEDPLTRPRNVSRRSHLSTDANLVKDLLRKAGGDKATVVKWLETMGEEITIEDLGQDFDHYGDDIDVVATQLGAPRSYFCSISAHLFRDPVLLSTGQTYERCAIQRWFSEGGRICPNTGVRLPTPVTMTPNVVLRHAIEDWAMQNASWMLGPTGRLPPVECEKEFHEIPLPEQEQADMALAIRLQEGEMRQQDRRQHIGGRINQGRRTISQENRIQRCIYLLFFISTAHVLFFLYAMYSAEWKFEKIDNNPLIGMGAKAIRQVGGTNLNLISEKNEWWRIATSVFMTVGCLHLQWVLCCLWTCGRFLSTKISFISLGIIYVVSSLCGVLFSINLSTGAETAAGSAGVFGLMGAVIVETIVYRKHYKNHLISVAFVVFIGSGGVLMGMTPFLDNWSSLGGLIGGICISMALRLTHRGLQTSRKWLEYLLIASQVLLFVVTGIFVVAGVIGIVLEGVSSEDCKLCKQLTCADVAWWNCESAVLPPDDIKCGTDIRGNLKTIITCPSGVNHTIQLTNIRQKEIDRHCRDLCLLDESNGVESPSEPSQSSDESSIVFVPPEISNGGLSLEGGNFRKSKTE